VLSAKLLIKKILFSGLTKLESLNLDSCRIGDEGLVHLSGDCYFCCYTVIMDIRIRYSFIVMWL
jgi:hypothetical protein